MDLFYLYGFSGGVEAVGLDVGGDVGGEVTCFGCRAVEMHGEEVGDLDAAEENFSPAGVVGSLTHVDREHDDVDFRGVFRDAVDNFGEMVFGLACLLFVGFLVPVPVVEVSGMEYAGSVFHGHEE